MHTTNLSVQKRFLTMAGYSDEPVTMAGFFDESSTEDNNNNILRHDDAASLNENYYRDYNQNVANDNYNGHVDNQIVLTEQRNYNTTITTTTTTNNNINTNEINTNNAVSITERQQKKRRRRIEEEEDQETTVAAAKAKKKTKSQINGEDDDYDYKMNEQARIILKKYYKPQFKAKKNISDNVLLKFLINVLNDDGTFYVTNINGNATTNKRLSGFRKILLGIVIRGLSSPLPEIILGKKSLITPRIITELGLFLSSNDNDIRINTTANNTTTAIALDYLFNSIEDDRVFVLMSLTIGIYLDFFNKKKKQKKSTRATANNINKPTTRGDTKRGIYNKDINNNNFLEEFINIKHRWIILESLLHSICVESDNDQLNILENSVIYTTINSIRNILFNRMLEGALKYSQEKRNEAMIELIKPLDASFAFSMINNDNFELVTKVVEKKHLITLFGPLTTKPLPKEINEDCCYCNNYCYYSSPFFCNYFKFDGKKKNINNFNMSELGVYWDHKHRNASLKNVLLKNVTKKVLNAFNIIDKLNEDEDVDDDDEEEQQRNKQRRIEEYAQRLEEKFQNFNELQRFKIIYYWDIPVPILSQVFYNLIYHINIIEIKLQWSTNNERRKDNRMLGWLLDRIITETGDFYYIPSSDVDTALEIMLTFGLIDSFSHFIEKYKEKFTVKRIKHFALLIITKIALCQKWYLIMQALKFMFVQFPWLLNTWIDHAGQTFLSYCACNAAYSSRIQLKDLLSLDIVRKYINVESRNGCNLLFSSADRLWTKHDHSIFSVIKIGEANVMHVNEHGESVLHRLAASNYSFAFRCFRDEKKLLKQLEIILELRRKKDGATALMIALVEENLDVASELFRLGASAKSKFGNSQTLTTVDALFLKKKWLSLTFLAENGIRPNYSIIAKSFKNGDIFNEEYLVGATGMEIDEYEKIYCTVEPFMNKYKTFIEQNTKIQKFVRFSDFTWSLFSDTSPRSLYSDPYKNRQSFEWPRKILSLLWLVNDNDRIIEYVSELCEHNNFNNEKCPICLREFSNEDDDDDDEEEEEGEIRKREREPWNKGITECGHVIHRICWDTLLYSNNNDNDKRYPTCPLCREPTKFLFSDNQDDETGGRRFDDDINNNNIISLPLPLNDELKYYDPPTTPTMTISEGKRYRKKVTLGNDKGMYPTIARYEFFINGKWVDESSSLNIL